ncbi:MAG TPA: GDP-L-fucose synthase [Opitutaceae bacterium]|nr:GDP-L-fucose synthase [Opitutaceae bacterium]HND62903.1 GDP-L-fucose synthase [Opitutaceae bacterium]
MRLFIAGAQGMVGSALVRRFSRESGVTLLAPSRAELDLTSQASLDAFYATERPDVAVIAAAKVGGIHANNTYPAEFIFSNLIIATNAIDGAYRHGVKRLLFLGSSCIYPKHAPQPMPEDCLLSGPLEPTNEAYAIAKITGLKLAQYYRRQYGVMFHSAMPTNLYGPGDNYHLQNSHVLPALIRKFHEAKEAGRPEVVAWGTGAPRREFLHVDDLADACAFLLRLENPPDWVNVGTGTDVTIRELTETVAAVTGFTGRIAWDHTKPDGTPRKLLDVSRLSGLGWRARVALREGVERTYASYLAEKAAGTLRT